MSFLRAFSALAVALLLVGVVSVLIGVVFTKCGSSKPRWSYMSDDGVVHVAYQTIRHSTGVPSDERHLPLPEALAQAEKDFGAPFKAPVTDPRRIFLSYMTVRVDVPESAYPFGHYPTVTMWLVMEPNLLPDGSLDPAQRPGMASPANVLLEVKRPVEGLRPLSPTTRHLEVASNTAGTVYIHQFHEADGSVKDVRLYWLDGNTQYMIEQVPRRPVRTQEEMLALVDLIASQ